jgi:hypothetical protein
MTTTNKIAVRAVSAGGSGLKSNQINKGKA